MHDPKILFPFSIHNDFSKIKKIEKYTKFGYIMEGRDFIDTSLGNCGSFMLGFDRTDIIEQVTNKCQTIPFISGEFMTTSDAVIELGEKLYNLTDGYRSFFSTSGSDAIEGALKIARLKHLVQGNKTKKYIVGIEQSYHGSTYLSSSISGGSFMTSCLGRSDMCFEVKRSTDSLEQFNFIVEKINHLGAENISSIILETCSWRSGITCYNDEFWSNVRKLCTEKNIIFIIDDIAMCGGKNGKFLGFNVKPDIFTMGKALTGGYFPLSAFLINEDIYSTVRDEFWSHGFTYTFNISGIYSTLAYLDILEKENIFDSYPLVYNKAQNCFIKLKEQKLIRGFNNYGLYFSLILNDIPDGINLEDEFFKDGLNVGIENYQWFWLQIIIPLNADDIYFDTLFERLQITLLRLLNV